MTNYYMPLALILAALSCFFVYKSFDRHSTNIRRTVLISVFTALSIISRHVFSASPFKPMTAIVILTGIYLGGEAGFLCGSFTALISNIAFGQGPWTPFQMVAFGVIGLMAGFLKTILKKNKLLLIVYAGISGVFYSLIVDIWTVLWVNGGFSLEYYIAACSTAIPYTVSYILSNIVFIYLVERYVGRKVDRIILKYEI